MKAVSHVSHPKPSLMCHLFNILVCPVQNNGSAMWWLMQAEEMERVHSEFCKFTGCPDNNSQPGMLFMVLCWAELFHGYNGKFPW